MDGRKENILFSREEISKRVKEVGQVISKDYKDKKLYVLSLLRGSFIFTSDLVRELSIPVSIGFMTTSSYGNEEVSTGNVQVTQDISDNIEGYDVLIVDDIIDSGTTMKFIKDYITKYNPNSIKSCVLLDKPSRRTVEISSDYTCFTIEDVFVAGYGLNYGDYYRNIPYVFNWEEQ